MKTKREQKEIEKQLNLIGKLYSQIDELKAENKKLKQEHKNRVQEQKSDTPTVAGNYFDWDKYASSLKDEFGESLIEEGAGEEDAYNWWLQDVTVNDIVESVKKHLQPASPMVLWPVVFWNRFDKDKPQGDAEYLVCNTDGVIRVSYFDGTHWGYLSTVRENITHWSVLPQAPIV